MARDFNGSTGYLNCGDLSSLETDYLTVSAWARPASVASFQYIMCRDAGGSDRCYGFGSATTNAMYSFAFNSSGGVAETYGSTTITTDVWHHFVVTYDGTTLRQYLDSVAEGTGSLSGTLKKSVTTTHRIGQQENGGNYWNGDIAEVGFWDVALSTGEITSLYRGFAPTLVRPSSLVGYWPITGTSPEINRMDATAATVSGTCPVSAHPRMIYPRRKQAWSPAAAAGGLSIPVAMHNYRRRRTA